MNADTPVEVTPVLVTASVLELGLLLVGVWVLWRYRLSPAAREARATSYAPLGAWRLLPSDFLTAALCVVFGGLGLQFLTLSIGRGIPALSADPQRWLILQGISFQLGMLAGAVAGWAYTRKRGNVLPGGDPFPLPTLRAGVFTFLAVLPAVTVVSLAWTGVLRLLGIDPPRQELVELFLNAESRSTAIIMAGFAVLIAPITEELIFRAGLFRYLRTRVPRWAALAIPSVLFASLHGNLAAMAPLAALGVVFSLAYEQTGRIAVPMIAHALFNLNTLVLLLTGVTA